LADVPIVTLPAISRLPPNQDHTVVQTIVPHVIFAFNEPVNIEFVNVIQFCIVTVHDVEFTTVVANHEIVVNAHVIIALSANTIVIASTPNITLPPQVFHAVVMVLAHLISKFQAPANVIHDLSVTFQ
jgi:hypothetical protein